MTVGTVEIMIALSVLLQWKSGEKSRRKVSIYKYSNSCTVMGRVASDNKYRIRTLNCGSLSIVFAKASEVIMKHGYIYICIYKKGTVFRQTYPPFKPGDEISTLRILGFGRCYNWFIYIYVQDLMKVYKNNTKITLHKKNNTIAV